MSNSDTYWRELDIERKFRETKLLEVTPVGNNLVLAYLAARAGNAALVLTARKGGRLWAR